VLLFVALAVWVFPLQEAGADDTGFKVATNVVSTGSWSNCTAAVLNSNNNQYASSNGSINSYCVISTFAFGIPAAKTINGIEVQVEGRGSTASTVYYKLALSWDAGSSWTSDKTNSFSSTTDVTRTHGGSADTWGRTWRPSDFTDGNFQLRIARTSGSGSVWADLIQVKVYYTAYVEKLAYGSATAGTSWVVPSGVSSITVKAWGAGGGGGGGSSAFSGGYGAGAGFAQATLTVTAGETLTVRVGGGGYGGGGGNGSNAGGGGGGGGYSGVFRSSTKLIVAAGGGGGGGAGGGVYGEPNYSNGYNGGAGGGTTGGQGDIWYNNGASSSAGGMGGNNAAAGASLAGGNGGNSAYGGGGSGGSGGTNGGAAGGIGSDQYYSYSAGGGGGGAGHFGGGGGSSADWDNYSGGGGGGGSSYTTGTDTSTSSGSSQNAGNYSDSDCSTWVGYGGTAGSFNSNGGEGNPGRVVISYAPAVTLDDHAAGQESNKFAGTNVVRGGELFAFSLTNNSGSQVTVTQVQFQLSAVTGIAQSDLSSLLIYQDDNNDGAVGAGETTTVGGAGAVNAGVTTITFSTSFALAASSTVNYILKGSAVYLASGDTMTMALGMSNISLSSGSMGGSTTSVTQAATPTKSTYTSATAGTSWVVPTGVTSITVKAWGGGGGGGGGGGDDYSFWGGYGFGAGFAKATIAVTAGETLTVRVGGGGGGGGAYVTAAGGGGGGGYSGLLRSSTKLIIAAGGGGGGGAGGVDQVGSGGAGGGTTGGDGTQYGGYGGTQSAGGTNGGCNATNGSSLSGGNGGSYNQGGGAGGAGGTNGGGAGATGDNYWQGGGGGGGGSGYYGGGGGSCANYNGGGGGGGGSSYTTGTGTSTSSGSGTSPGATGDSDWDGYAGYGANGGAPYNAGVNGTAGRVVIAYLAAPTAVDLISFTAAGAGVAVRVGWQTGEESDNKGFNLYRAASAGGPYAKLNSGLIPSGSVSSEGRDYAFIDTLVSRGAIYYYKLEDVDVSGAVTTHGPVCVDWDGDGIPDDWEIAHGLDPGVNDANLDSDGDGVPNWLEHQRGTDPFNPDSDGDGVLDGAEKKSPGYSGASGRPDFGDGVQVLSADEKGLTIELLSPAFDATPVTVGGQAFERLRVPAYVHGLTLSAGRPQLPVKGLLLEIPQGKRARLTVLEEASRTLAGYRVYPAPRWEKAANQTLAEVFTLDESAYGSDAYYPAAAAELSAEYLLRGQGRQRLVFHPLRFKAATGELLHAERIRVRVEYVEASAAGASVQRLAVQAPAAATGWSIPAGAAYKLSTSEEGIYLVTRDWLTVQGIGPTEIDAINLSQVQLFNRGSEQAIQVYDQNANNRLDAGDFISFYAEPVPAAYAKYARYNLYWLIDAGSAGPRRMAAVEGAPAGGPLASSHTARVHHELDLTYLPTATGENGLERWLFLPVALGAGFAGGGSAKDYTLSLPGALSTGELTLRLYSPYAMAHAAAVSLNGTSLGTAAWSGIGWSETVFEAPNLLAGANTLSLLCQEELDKTAVDWFEVAYERDFTAVADSLKFTHAGGYRYRLEGFSANAVEVLDISEPAAVKRVVNGAFSGAGPYTLELEPAGAGGTRSYLAVGAAAVKSPVAAAGERASDLASSANGADWILITHRELGWDSGQPRGWVNDLVSLRQGQGLRTAVVDVADIFDEFGYGFASPQAIKAFLAHAFESWQPPAPRYVLLVGDATYDYKNHWGLSPAPANHVPAYLIFTTHYGETACDECYGQVSGEDALADLHIGRLPAATAAQAEEMVAKIIAYESAPNSRSWERRLVLVADNAAEEWESVFEAINEEAAALLPAGFDSPERFYLTEYENEQLAVGDLTADLLAAIDAGALIVNYAGHGSLGIWASERILDNRGGAYRSDAAGLANAGKYPFVVNMACLTGYFLNPQPESAWQSLAEGLMRPADKGAVAALMPTGMTEPDGQQLMSSALYAAIFGQDMRTLGPAVAAAKEQLLANGGSLYEETANTFMLFGDPATTLKLPLPRRPIGLTAQRQADGTVLLTWAAALDCDGNPVTGYNLYRRRSTEPGYTRLNTALITALSFIDAGLITAPAGELYYYALGAVDDLSEESVKSAAAALTVTAPDAGDTGDGGTAGAGAGSGGGGCFISTAGSEFWSDLLRPLAAMALIACLIWISRRSRRQ
jgi:hypothetical protein